MTGAANLMRLEGVPQWIKIGLAHVGQQQVLVVGGANLAETVAVGEVGHRVHLVGGDVARRYARFLQRHERVAVALDLVLGDVVAHPGRKRLVALEPLREAEIIGGGGLIRRWREEAAHPLDFRLVQHQPGILDVFPFRLDLLAEFLRPQRLDQDLDAGLVNIVAPAVLVVDPQDGFQIGQQIALGQELADDLADHRGTAQPAADQHPEAEFALFVTQQIEADVVNLGRRAVVNGPGDGDLELARQVGKFRVEGGPLADDLAVDARIFDFVRSHAGEVVGGDVADAVTAGLDGVHLDLRQFGQDVGRLFQLRPVVLDVLAGGEMAEALVIATGDVGQRPQLWRGQQPVGDGDPQHRRVALDIEAVHQPQRPEFIVAQLAGQIAPDLAPILGYPLVHERLIVGVVLIHGSRLKVRLHSARATIASSYLVKTLTLRLYANKEFFYHKFITFFHPTVQAIPHKPPAGSGS